MISIIAPVYNEADNLTELYNRVVSAAERTGEKFEFILVENGSQDNSLGIIKDLRKKDPRIKFISLSRNFGHQGAIVAGLAHASGSAVISLDADLQHPPELILELVRLWKNGYEVVYTLKEPKEHDKKFYPYLKKVFYKLINHISIIKLAYGESDYRLLDQKVVASILEIPEKSKFLRGIVKWVGFSQIGVKYEASPRTKGESKFSIWNYINFALDGIFSFSIIPIRIFFWCGIIITFFCLLFAFYYLLMGVVNLFYPESFPLPPGWVTIAVSIFFLGSIQLIGIGCLGEYIGRIYSQTKNRPDFVVKEKGLE